MTTPSTAAPASPFRSVFHVLGLALLAGLAGLLPGTSAGAAEPAAGTLSESSPVLAWSGGPLPSTQAASCAGPGSPECDHFALSIVPPAGGFAVEIVLTPTAADDWDLQVWGSDGNVAGSSGEPPALPETVILQNPAAGTYTVSASPYLVTFGYDATARLVEGDEPPPPPTPSGERAPTYASHPAPGGMGTGAGEPTLGVNHKTGKVMYIAGTETLRVTFDDCSSPAADTWEDVSFLTTGITTFDPILFTDQAEGRTFVSQLLPTKLSLMAFTDDDGETWTPSQGAGFNSGADHQGVGGGPFAEDSPLQAIGPYPNAVYYCSQDVALAQCAVSLDGGLTFGPAVPIYTELDCGGLHGHPKVGPTGVVYVPNKDCLAGQGVVRSTDNGLTWQVKRIGGTSAGQWDPSIAVGAAGTVYAGMANGDGHPWVAVSYDDGETWTHLQDVGTSFKIANTAFPVMIAGDDDRAAFAFLGTSATGDGAGDDPAWPGVWHLYVAHTYDAGRTWVTSNATPGDPVQRGTICGGGTLGCGNGTRNLLDFNDVTVDAEGRVLVSFADGCVGPCVDGGPNSGTELGTIARQVSGKRLYSAFDTVDVPAAPALSATFGAGGVELAWAEPDDRGTPVTAYHVYRRVEGDPPQLLATLGATARSYVDGAAGPGDDVGYRLTAENAVGESASCREATPGVAGPVESPCELPGVTVATDREGDVATGGSRQHDLLALHVAEPATADGAETLVFTMKVPDLEPPPANSIWRAVWIDGGGTTRFVDLRTTDLLAGVACNYGYLDGNIFTSEGDADGCAFTADGTIRVTVAKDKVGSPAPGDALGGVYARAELLAGVLGTGALVVMDSTGAGGYVVVGNASCANGAPVAADDAATTDEGAAVTVDVLANDVDPDGDALRLAGAGPAANGDVAENADGTVTYAPANGFSGADAFPYTVSDSRGATDTATVTVTVRPAGNHPPEAADDTATTRENRPIHVDVLVNDDDADGDALEIVAITPAGQGRVIAKKNGVVSYKPDAGFVGIDVFTYTVSDGHGGTDTATVTVTVDAK